MADEPSPDVVVVGGAAGAVIAHILAEQGKRVALLWRTDVEGATDTNQKWLHSGLLYPSRELAVQAWRNYREDWKIKRRYLEGREQACILARHPDTVSERESMWESWRLEEHEHDLPEPMPLRPEEKARLRDHEITFFDGWTTPDCVIDFPRMVGDLRQHLDGQRGGNDHLPALKETRHKVMKGAKVVKLRSATNGITGVDVDWEGHQFTLSCEQCVLAAGAWSQELLRDVGVRLPLIVKKCLVLEVPNEKLPVSQITVCLDVEKEDGTPGDVTLVPYQGKTLAAGTDFKVVYDPGEHKLKELECGEFEIAALIAELTQCFTRVGQLSPNDYTAHKCFKTEHYNPDHPDVDLKVYTHATGHDIPGLIVAFPGKASIMFDLARKVADVVF